jgi:hypothetical protein
MTKPSKTLLLLLLLAIMIGEVSSDTQVFPCSYKQPPLIPNFVDSTNGQYDNTTSANICHNGTHLFFNWSSYDQDIISTYKNCNDPLYK